MRTLYLGVAAGPPFLSFISRCEAWGWLWISVDLSTGIFTVRVCPGYFWAYAAPVVYYAALPCGAAMMVEEVV